MTSERRAKSDAGLRGEGFVTIAFTAFAALLLGLLFIPISMAQQKGQRTFHSAEEASLALFTAAQQENEGALLDILGPEGKEVISSGDPAEDMNERVGFVVKYQQMHRLAKDSDGSTTLYVGAENWPFPIPLVSRSGAWFFDTHEGKQEILLRRIGNNELAAMDACHQLVDAEKEYYQKAFNGEHNYTQRLVSEKGKHDGLFWSETADEFDSTIDPLIAHAGQENAKSADGSEEPIPFNGYYFRVLTGQGKNAPGGAKNYVVDGKMAAGFAIVAYPAEYRSSGVMTFIVNESGAVYEKDLGPKTAKIVTTMTDYNPDSSWRRTE